MAESKYPSEKEMYEREAAEELEKYESARSWMKLVNATVSKVKEEKARLVLKQNCLEGATMKAVLVDKKAEIYMSRSTATRDTKRKVLLIFLAVWFRFKVAWKNWRKIFIKMSQFEAK